MAEEEPKEWNPEYKVEEPLISDTSGGYDNRGFSVDAKTNSMNVGYGTRLNVDGLIIKSGTNILLDKGGNIKFTSIIAPAACIATLVATGTGNVDNGTHKYKVTYVNAFGETELGTASNEVTVDATHKQVALSNIPVSSLFSVAKRKIYRTKAGGTSYYLLTTINDNTTTTYTDNIADASLGADGTYRANDTFGKFLMDDIVCGNFGGGNTFLGSYAGYSNTYGYRDIFIGNNAGKNNTIGYDNIFLGIEAGKSITTGHNNIAIGNNALTVNTTGYNNITIGQNTLVLDTSGYDNTVIGYQALGHNNGGYQNIAIGAYAGFYDTSPARNLYINSIDRGNVTGDKTKSIIYGFMADNASDQQLYFNSRVIFSVSKTPASASAVGITGEICWDSNYIYVCIATNTWKRVAISTW